MLGSSLPSPAGLSSASFSGIISISISTLPCKPQMYSSLVQAHRCITIKGYFTEIGEKKHRMYAYGTNHKLRVAFSHLIDWPESIQFFRLKQVDCLGIGIELW